jgi:SAM-dependent methyltransferase
MGRISDFLSRALEGIAMAEQKTAMANSVTAMTRWDKVALTRWGEYIIALEKRVVLQAQQMAGPPAKAVDWGCGSGRWSKILHESGWQVTCVDVDAESLEICRQNVPAAVHILAEKTARTVECPTQSARLLLCIEVGPVIERPWFLEEARRILQPGGLLVGVWWNRLSFRGVACRLKYRLQGSVDAENFYNYSFGEQKRKLVKAGFELSKAEGFCWGPFGRSSDSRWIPFFVRCERWLGLNRCPALSPWVMVMARKTE